MTSLTALLTRMSRHVTWILAAIALIAAMGGTWMTSATANAAPADSLTRRPDARTTTSGTTTSGTTTSGTTTSGTPTSATTARGTAASSATVDSSFDDEPAPRKKRAVAGKLNLNTATEDQLMQLPQVGPAKAERIVTWRHKNGGFKRTADLRRVKGFGYKTFKRLEPLLDIRGETTLAPK